MVDILRSNFTVHVATLLVVMNSAGTARNGEKFCAPNKNVTDVYFQTLRIIREAGIPERRQELRLATPLTPVRWRETGICWV